MPDSRASRSSRDTGQPVGDPYLFLVLDGNQPGQPLWRHRIGNIDEVQIGRGTERSIQRQVRDGKKCLCLRFPDPWMSSLHARLVCGETNISMSDPGSKNGSYINGTRLSNAVLTDGDILQFGHTFFIFRSELPSHPDEMPDTVSDTDAPPGLSSMLSPLSNSFLSFGRAAASGQNLVIEGEPGTGKSMLAHAAHALSGGGDACVVLMVNDLHEDVFERKLCGGQGDGKGAVAEAGAGTLVLENIDTMSLRAQAVLSHLLHEREVKPTDGGAAVPLQCRFVCTATGDLSELVSNGRFDGYLARQLSEFLLHLPPLRRRREDLGLLIHGMLARSGQSERTIFSSEAAYVLLSYDWPRNVRELENCVATALAWRSSNTIELTHLPPELHKPKDFDKHAGGDTIDTVELVQQDLEKRANIIASLRARSGQMFNSRDSVEEMRSQFQRWLSRTDTDPTKKK
jgi:hypothetical protein